MSRPPRLNHAGTWLAWFVWLPVVWVLLLPPALAVDANDLLPPERAFRMAARMEHDVAVVTWEIAEGYYLYRSKFRFVPRTPGVSAGEPIFPRGEIKQDEYLGEVETYHGKGEARLPLSRETPAITSVALEITVQGCAEAGVCYPPFKQTVNLAWPTAPVAAAPPAPGLGEALQSLGLKSTPDLLPADQAFRFLAEARDADTLWVSWQIADGYYLYREKFRFQLTGEGITLGPYEIPRGQPRHDEEFGAVETFSREVGFALPLIRTPGSSGSVRLEAHFQGCAERGVCYPPMAKVVELALPASDANRGNPGAASAVAADCEIGPATGFVEPAALSEQCEIATGLHHDSIWLTAVSFLGMGLLLAFTPCIFPMIPILSGIIVGHGHRITTRRAFLLSLSYVIASALAYTAFGVLAGLFGANLQALFQEPRVIAAFAGVFVVLALSMFGLFELQVPATLQSRLTILSNRQTDGTLAGAALMGALSALIVGPCVAAPLAGALIYIGQTGDALLGGVALFALGLGMGLPLLAIGASAGRLLPRAGAWMNAVKATFGVGLLGIAVWLLERIVPPALTLFLWALLLIIPAIFLGALDALPAAASGRRKLFKGVGIVMLTYGILLLIGVAANSTDPLQPLRGLAAAPSREAAATLSFREVRSVPELRQQIAAAAASGRWTMLDFYADWCVSCKEMERYTYADPKVQATLRDMVLLKADVTANSATDQDLLHEFGLVGPPATLFFGPDQAERKAARVVGYIDAGDFLNHLARIIHP